MRMHCALTIQERGVLLPNLVLLIDEPLLHLVGVILLLPAHHASCDAQRALPVSTILHNSCRSGSLLGVCRYRQRGV